MNEYKFYKEETGKWYIDLPDYTGPKKDLEMVLGADTMLNIIAQEKNIIHLILSDKYFEGSDFLEFVKEGSDEGGAYYNLPYYTGTYYNLEMWLCDVTKYIFGKFPSKIFLTNLNKNA